MKTVGGKRILGMVLALSDQEAFLPYAETTWSLNNRTADWWHSAETAVSVQDNAAILLHCLHCEFSQNLLNDWKKPKSSNALKRDQKVSASVRVNVPENKLIKTIFPAHQWNASITTDYGRILLDAETDYWTQEGLGQNQTQGGFSIDKSTGIVMNAYILDVKEQGFASLQEIRDFDYFRNAGLFEQLTGHVSMHVLAVNNIKDNVRSVVDGQDVEVSDNRYDAETDVWLRVTDANKVTEILNVALDSGIITMSDGFWTFQTDYETLRIYAKVHKNYIQLCTDKILFNRTEFDEELKPNPVFELKIGITDLLKRVSGSMSIFANAALDVNIVDGLEIKWVSGQRFSGEIKLTDKRTDALLSIMKFIISSPQVLVLLRNYI
jgi:hypothetical protein